MNWVNRRQSMNIASLWTWVCTCLVVPSLLGMYCGPGYVHVLLSPHYWVCTVGLGMYMSCCPLTIGYVLWAWVCTCLVVPSLLGMYCGPGYVHVLLSPHYWVCTVGLGMYMSCPLTIGYVLWAWVCTCCPLTIGYVLQGAPSPPNRTLLDTSRRQVSLTYIMCYMAMQWLTQRLAIVRDSVS